MPAKRKRVPVKSPDESPDESSKSKRPKTCSSSLITAIGKLKGGNKSFVLRTAKVLLEDTAERKKRNGILKNTTNEEKKKELKKKKFLTTAGVYKMSNILDEKQNPNV